MKCQVSGKNKQLIFIGLLLNLENNFSVNSKTKKCTYLHIYFTKNAFVPFV